MAYLVVAYPNIKQGDFERIQEYRRKNDPKFFSVINPHFTIVFSINDIEEHDFISEVESKSKDTRKIKFEINIAAVEKDDSGEYYHEFLIPDKGYSEVVKLHDNLYSGLFSKNLRLDLGFTPHIGIGNSNDVNISQKRIDQLNDKGISISGIIDSLDIIEYKDSSVRTLQRINLED